MTGNELRSVDQFLIGCLLNNPQLTTLLGTTPEEQADDLHRIWVEVMPEGAPYPGVILGYMAGADTTAFGEVRVVTRPIYRVWAVAVGDSWAEASNLSDEIDAAIQGVSGTLDGIKIGGFYRVQPLRQHEVRAGVRYNYVGGLYRSFVSP